jgi:hypothetical protein
MVQNETLTKAEKPWLDLDRPTLLQFLMLLAFGLMAGAAAGLLFS